MRQSAMLRFLELLQAELGADDARAELGGQDPTDPRLLFTLIPGGFRVVAIYAEPPSEREHKQHKLEELSRGFGHTLSQGSVPAPPPSPADTAQKRLDTALEALRTRTGAVEVVIVDRQSPVLWGAADPSRHEDDVSELTQIGDALHALLESGVDLDAICALEPADLESRLRDLAVESGPAALLGRAVQEHDDTALRHYLLTALSIARAIKESGASHAVRFTHHSVQFGYMVRAFANIYLMVLVFEGAFSELYVESAAIHALPAIEQLMLALPPREPPPAAGRGRVIRMRKRR
jgi:hypothetical protein